MPNNHILQMGFAIIPVGERFKMNFQPTRPDIGEFYLVTGKSTKIKEHLKNFEKVFAEIDTKTYTKDECDQFIAQYQDLFDFVIQK